MGASIIRRIGAARLHWRLERAYRELKLELGSGSLVGRGWSGFHHHASSLCIAAYRFLISRET